jgi:hypothetical protein
MVLSGHYKYRRFGQMPSYLFSRLQAKSSSSVSATSAVVDIAIPTMGRTIVLVHTATPNTARMMLSGHHDVSAG